MEYKRSYKVLFVSAEVAPMAKVGGLGDVSSALPKALRQLGHDVRVIMPRYGIVDEARYPMTTIVPECKVTVRGTPTSFSLRQTKLYDDLPVYLVEQPYYYGRNSVYGFSDDSERFAFFCRAVLEGIRDLDWHPDIIHCNDWHTGLIPYWMHTAYADDPFYADVSTVYTLHILAYQGSFPRGLLDALGMGTTTPEGEYVNPVQLGILHADMINTVSETYACEILTPAYGEGLHELLNQRENRLVGILNGIDHDIYNPSSDPALAVRYDVNNTMHKCDNKLALQREFNLPLEPRTPLIGMVTRLAEQKGLELLIQVLEQVLQEVQVQMIVLGSGDQRYQDFFRGLASCYPHKLGLALGFNAALAQRIYAGSDIFLMPSRVEPCGLGQLIALRYGSIPVVRRTGGLADTVKNYLPGSDEGNGFSFTNYTPFALSSTLMRALENYEHRDVWQSLVRRAMLTDCSWTASARKYVDLYTRAITM